MPLLGSLGIRYFLFLPSLLGNRIPLKPSFLQQQHQDLLCWLLFYEKQIQNIIKESHSEIVTVARDFFVISKSGQRIEIEALYKKLKPFGIMQFVRSGRISVSKAKMEISTLLEELS